MALLRAPRGLIVQDYHALRSMVIHLEPTLSFAIAYAGYTEAHKATHQALEAAWARLAARHGDLKFYAGFVSADERGVHRGLLGKETRRLRGDVEALGELIFKAGRAIVRDLDGKGRGGVFEMDVHMGAVGMVGVRWELEESGI
jgi:hypothetical protein